MNPSVVDSGGLKGRGDPSRRRILASAAGIVAALPAAADTLADVPPRGPGAPLSATSERSEYVHLARIPESTLGRRSVDPGEAINSKTPLDKLVGTINPGRLALRAQPFRRARYRSHPASAAGPGHGEA